jgi:MFS family permease
MWQESVNSRKLRGGIAFLVSLLMLTCLTQQTSPGWLLAAYALFGVGLGMVNPAITDSAVAGMPLSQAGVAAAIASTGRQVGAAIGVAVAGTLVAISNAHGTDFTTATHAIRWLMTASSAVVLVLGFAANTSWARASTRRVMNLLEDTAMGQTSTTDAGTTGRASPKCKHVAMPERYERGRKEHAQQ